MTNKYDFNAYDTAVALILTRYLSSTGEVKKELGRVVGTGTIDGTALADLLDRAAAWAEEGIKPSDDPKTEKLMDAVKDYEDNAGRRVTFEYILIKGLNDSPKHAEELASLIKRHAIYAYVNIIPLNPVKEKPFERPSENAIHTFHDRLMKAGITTTIRKEFGTDIDAACGQLRVKVEKEKRDA